MELAKPHNHYVMGANGKPKFCFSEDEENEMVDNEEAKMIENQNDEMVDN